MGSPCGPASGEGGGLVLVERRRGRGEGQRKDRGNRRGGTAGRKEGEEEGRGSRRGGAAGGKKEGGNQPPLDFLGLEPSRAHI